MAGGYPAALARSTARRRATWYLDSLDALVQRDVRDMSRITSLAALRRLLAVAAAHTAQLLNVAGLAAPFQLSRPTINDYVTLLERVFLLCRLPPWHSNRLSRLVKTPKLLDAPLTFFHFRNRDGVEVDMAIERGARQLVGVEVKAAATVTAADFSGLRKLQEGSSTRFRCGVVLYDGETTASFGDGIYAVPLRSLWKRRDRLLRIRRRRRRENQRNRPYCDTAAANSAARRRACSTRRVKSSRPRTAW